MKHLAKNGSKDLNNDKAKKTGKKNPVKITGRNLKASSIGWEIALPIVSGPVVGYFLDGRFETSPRYTLIFLGIGLAIASINVIRFIFYEYSQIHASENEKKKNE